MAMSMPDESDPGQSAGGTRDISGSKTTMKILGDLGLVGLSFLPIGAAIRGGQLVYKGLKGAKAAAELRKVPKVASALRASRPALKSAPKIKPGASVQTGKPSPLAKPKPQAQAKPKPAEKPKPAQATTSGTRGKPTAGAGRANLKPSGPATRGSRKPVRAERKPVKAERKPVRAATKVTPKTKPKAKPNAAAAKKRAAAQRTIDTLLGTLVAGGALGVASKAVSPTKPKADPKKTAPKKRAKPGGTNKGADPKKAKPKARGPQTRGSVAPQKTTSRKSGPSTRSGAKRGATKIVTAGKNVGFGPKGNIFPKNAEDRARLMRLYGGTGSAAAKAAAAGKQGTLKKGKK